MNSWSSFKENEIQIRAITRSPKFSLSTGFVFTVLTKDVFCSTAICYRMFVAWLALYHRGSTIVSKTKTVSCDRGSATWKRRENTSFKCDDFTGRETAMTRFNWPVLFCVATGGWAPEYKTPIPNVNIHVFVWVYNSLYLHHCYPKYEVFSRSFRYSWLVTSR